jgi:hypothetical protein
MQTEIEVSKGYTLIVSSKKVEGLRDTYNLALSTKWAGAKDPEGAHEKYSICLTRDQLAEFALAIWKGVDA